MNRRTRKHFFRATAIFSLALWMFMAVAENYEPLHAWLHGGAIPHDDNCAIVALTHGKVEATVCDVPIVTPATWIEITRRIEFSPFITAVENFSDGRAPPFLSA